MKEWIQKARSKWEADDVDINNGAFTAAIDSTENILNFKFPSDFKDFYMVINGFNSFDMEEHMFTFWSLETIVEEFNRSTDKDFIGFCDYLIASHSIGFRKSKEGVYKDYEELIPIAETFEETITMINSGSQLIY